MSVKLTWQRVRGSNPFLSLERAFIFLHKILIYDVSCCSFVAQAESLSKRFVGSIRTVRAKIVSGYKEYSNTPFRVPAHPSRWTDSASRLHRDPEFIGIPCCVVLWQRAHKRYLAAPF
jgi:hypothetical protein